MHCTVFSSGCDQFDYNTYQTDVYDGHLELKTNYNIERLLGKPRKDTLKIVFTGDTQRFYDDLEDLVEEVNDILDLDAMIITGDITDFGIGREFKWINKELLKLKVPLLTVIGNHDCIANAKEIYREIFGPLDYSFTE
ncbi:MAG: metallophosphoesterase [Bacteroidetes bacterium]|nr:metallophosphoesterase [Bacteroidota bacterium]